MRESVPDRGVVYWASVLTPLSWGLALNLSGSYPRVSACCPPLAFCPAATARKKPFQTVRRFQVRK